MITAVSTIVVLGMLVFFHELGHFFVAKSVGIQVYEFSLGFGPKIFGFRKGETKYNIRVFPLGGFVRMAGMDSREDESEAMSDGVEVEAIDPKRGFASKKIWQRVAVIAAGPIMNFVLAIFLIAGIFFFNGIPGNISSQVGEVLPGSPALSAGLQKGDKILAVDKAKINQWEDLVKIIQQRPQQALTFLINRKGQQKEVTITPKADPQTGVGIIGIKPVEPKMIKQGLFSSLKLGTEYTIQSTVMIADVLGSMFQDFKADQLGGPIRITREIGNAAQMGLLRLTHLAAILSINLGLFNLLPIPALDGSRILFLLFEGIRGKRVDPEKENMVHLVGLGLLLLLMVFVTFNDINQWLFKGRM